VRCIGYLTWQGRPAVARVATKVVKLSVPRHGWLLAAQPRVQQIIAAALIVERESVLQSGAQAASGYGSPHRAKVARVNCGGDVRVVRDDVLVRWLVQRARFLLQKPRSG
jgi:hypothetical protein